MQFFIIFATHSDVCCIFGLMVCAGFFLYLSIKINVLLCFFVCCDEGRSERPAAMFCIFATSALYFSQQLADQSAVKKCPGASVVRGNLTGLH
ncbi:hypothetical protein [Aquitalea aquatica]|uniref:Uncharacterized protein n=1 Tax=Aquitalea aquatica TaxID=3044273 RepID=A0A838XWX2_9NEIS|nr:hypothetical protein [Aquitalea magnusonii]MBA4706896.1 hypothetical protein [Aquitalea magnusonii]